MPLNQGMDKENVVHLHNGVLLIVLLKLLLKELFKVFLKELLKNKDISKFEDKYDMYSLSSGY